MDSPEVGEDHDIGTHGLQTHKVQVHGYQEREGYRQIPLLLEKASDAVSH